MDNFEAYINDIVNPEQRLRVQELLQWVLNTFPELATRIAWNQPMFTHHDTFILGLSIFKAHLAIAPEAKTMSIFHDDIETSGYRQGSNLFRIKWSDTIDYALLKNIIQYNIDDKIECSTFWRA